MINSNKYNSAVALLFDSGEERVGVAGEGPADHDVLAELGELERLLRARVLDEDLWGVALDFAQRQIDVAALVEHDRAEAQVALAEGELVRARLLLEFADLLYGAEQPVEHILELRFRLLERRQVDSLEDLRAGDLVDGEQLGPVAGFDGQRDFFLRKVVDHFFLHWRHLVPRAGEVKLFRVVLQQGPYRLPLHFVHIY